MRKFLKTLGWSALGAALLAFSSGPILSAAVRPGTARFNKARFEADLPKTAPHKLSDLYKVFEEALRQGLGAQVKPESIRIRGQSWELLSNARFPQVEIKLKPFDTQGLRFNKAGFFFRKMDVDRSALWKSRIKVLQVREVQSRLVFTLSSLGLKLAGPSGVEPRLQADMDNQELIVDAQGSICGISCGVESRCHFVWDETSKTLRLVPLERRFGGHLIPHWLWALGKGPVTDKPILDFGFSWIPFNIQQVHVGWDEVDLSTDW
ncbi:MAG: hypothetical protein ACREKE_07525 [bacterium]